MKKKLSRRFVLAIAIPVSLIVVYHLILLVWMSGFSRNKLDATNQSAAANMVQSLELILGNVENAAKTFTYNQAVQSMAAGKMEVNPVSISNMLMMTQSYNPDMMDVMMTDWQGSTYSLKGYLTSQVEQTAKALALQHFTQRNAAEFLFFSVDGGENRYVLYCVPVFATQVVNHYGKQVGSVSILLNINGIGNTLKTGNDAQVELLDAGGQVVLQGAPVAEATAGAQAMVYTLAVPGTKMQLRYTATGSAGDWESCFFMWITLASVGIVLLLCLYLAWTVHRLFLRPIVHMNVEIGRLDKSDSGARLQDIPDNEIGSIGVQINEMLDNLHSLNQSVADGRERLYQMDILKKKTQLYAYQSQINPHFLYNMLQCMRGIALSRDMNEIADICTSMAAIFRYSIKGEGRVALSKELHMTDLYLNMLRLRFQDKLQYTIEVSEEFGECRIPKLSLQPLVENAVFHGLAPLGYEGRVEISARRQEGLLWLQIYNDGKGIPEDTLAEIQRQLALPVQVEIHTEEDASIGILNVHNKIRLYEGEEYGLSVESCPTSTTVTLKLPL